MRRIKVTLVELLILLAVIGILLLTLASLTMKGCVNNSEAIKALEDNGFTKNTIIESGIWGSFHGCSKDDPVWYESSSTNPIGKSVNVIVCCGGSLSFKGCTIRSK